MRREAAAAQWWRKNVAGLTPKALADATGFSERSIYLFESGCTNMGMPHPKKAWLRYKRACQAIHAELQNNIVFDWGRE